MGVNTLEQTFLPIPHTPQEWGGEGLSAYFSLHDEIHPLFFTHTIPGRENPALILYSLIESIIHNIKWTNRRTPLNWEKPEGHTKDWDEQREQMTPEKTNNSWNRFVIRLSEIFKNMLLPPQKKKLALQKKDTTRKWMFLEIRCMTGKFLKILSYKSK